MKHLAKRTLYLILGHFMAIFAVIGAIVPILPHTPFAICAAFFYSKSSPRLHRYILSIPGLGPAIDEWDKYKIIRKRAKVLSTVMIIIGLVGSLIYVRISIVLKIIQTIVLGLVLIFIWSRESELPTSKEIL